MVVASLRRRQRLAGRGGAPRSARPPAPLSVRGVWLSLLGIALLSAALRYALLVHVPGPFVFLDELGYQRLAQSIGTTGRFALFGKQGLSYSPLYPALLSPIYALGASATMAYAAMRAVNVVVISLSVFPIYKIARFVLPRRESVGVAGLTMLAPLMYYSALVMSENLAFPLCLTAIWAMLAAVDEPRPRNDALLLLSIVAATGARVQLVVLLPAAITALLLAAAGRSGVQATVARRLVRALKRHWLLLAGSAGLVAVAGARALIAGGGLYSVFGRYGAVGKAKLPNVWQVVEIAVEHVAGLELVLGVVPFVAALVGAFAFLRFGRPRRLVPFAAVAVSVTAWLLTETAVNAAQFDTDYRRIHERYLIYLLPLFLVVLLALVRVTPARLSTRPYLVAAVVASLLPTLIPFHALINISNVADSFGLLVYGRWTRGTSAYSAVPHAALIAVWVAAVLSLTYVVVRHRMRSVILLVSFAFLLLTSVVANRVQTVAISARGYLPTHRDWVDRAHPDGPVVLVTGTGQALPWHLTAFNNESVDRIYSLCRRRFGAEFGEQVVTIGRSGDLRTALGEAVVAPYAVVPESLGVRGSVLARNPNGHQVLVAPRGGRATVLRGTPARCD